jgi:hypothetical protein
VLFSLLYAVAVIIELVRRNINHSIKGNVKIGDAQLKALDYDSMTSLSSAEGEGAVTRAKTVRRDDGAVAAEDGIERRDWSISSGESGRTGPKQDNGLVGRNYIDVEIPKSRMVDVPL